MKRRTSNTYKLIPSKQSRSNSSAPMSFIPALPVKLNKESGDLHYAILDATAEISVADESILKNINHNVRPYKYTKEQDSVYQISNANIIYISIFLCTPVGEPWLNFHEVPLVITKRKMYDHRRLVLGYDSILSNLRLTFNFPKKELRVSAPIDLEVLTETGANYFLPSSIIEAENLIRMGSYRAALPMIVSGLEEVLIYQVAGTMSNGKSKPISYLLDQNWLSKKTKTDLKKIIELRNHAVHGLGLVKIEKKETQVALRLIKKIIADILNLNT